MKTVREVSRLTGVSVRALHHYDSIGLLRPTEVSPAGYRLYGDDALRRLQMILLFRELQFPLKEIARILDAPWFDQKKALQQQIELLKLRREHIENLIDLARGIQMTGVKKLDFSAFDTKKIDEYAEQAKAAWGKTEAYKEYERKSAGRCREAQQELGGKMMDIFREFGKIRDLAPDGAEAQALAEKLRGFITENYYTCTPQILRSLAEMYAGGGSMTENIEKAGGEGTAEFACQAIRHYCDSL